MQTVLERAEALREECLVAVKQDAQAYQVVMEAYRLPKDSPEAQAERSRLIQSATLQAAQVPLEVSEKAVSLLELATQVVMHGNLNAISDGGTAVALAQAALTGAGLNVRTNIASLEDKETGSQLLSRLQALEETAAGFQEQVRALLRTRGGLSLE